MRGARLLVLLALAMPALAQSRQVGRAPGAAAASLAPCLTSENLALFRVR